ncbi:MAG TPA: hypothetical protein VD836_17025 [Solirubrobacteraceae bacterium]|nr:hypothetical protein [Solirubrobacteraceae bacterium]
MLRRAVVVLAVLGVLAPIASAQIIPTFRKDSATDGRGALDIVRVAMSRSEDGRSLRGEVTMEKGWTTAALRSATGPSGSICITLYTAREPGADPADWLVCATPPKEGEELRGRVLRDRANGLPRQVANATVTRPTARTVYLRFAQSAINRPESVRFAAEAVTRAPRCPQPLGCRDTAPDAPTTGKLALRSTAPSG